MVETGVEIDNTGSRFVSMKINGEGLERDIFELSTPFSRFLAKALEEGVHLNTPVAKKLTKSSWIRMVDMIIIRTFGKAAGADEVLERRFILEEMGQIFAAEKGPVTCEDARQLIRKGTCYLYQNSPDYLKQQYPDLLNQRRGKGEFMADQRGTTRAIAGAVLQGATYQDLTTQGYSALRLSGPRKILAEYGLHVPRPREANLGNLNPH